MPGYAVLALAGTFVLGRMGILPRLALIFAIPIGAIGVSRLLKGRVSNRARVIAAIAYMAMPLGLDMISQGRIDVLLVVAGLPFIVRRLFELMDVPGFRTEPYAEPVSFGHRGWRSTYAGQRMIAVMLVALLTAMVPATLIAVTLIVLGVFLARLFERDEGVNTSGKWRFLGSFWLNVAILLLPLTVDVGLAGRRALGVFGLARGPWSVPVLRRTAARRGRQLRSLLGRLVAARRRADRTTPVQRRASAHRHEGRLDRDPDDRRRHARRASLDGIVRARP